MNAGADPSIKNHADHDAVYEAERNGKDRVARWLLTKGKGMEEDVLGGEGEAGGEEEEVVVSVGRDANGEGENEMVDVKEVVNGVSGMKMGEK